MGSLRALAIGLHVLALALVLVAGVEHTHRWWRHESSGWPVLLFAMVAVMALLTPNWLLRLLRRKR